METGPAGRFCIRERYEPDGRRANAHTSGWLHCSRRCLISLLGLLGLLLFSPARAEELHLDLRHDEGETVLNRILDTAGDFWSDAWMKRYEGKTYDEIRLKSLESGYVPMITGEGLQDFEPEVVSDVVFTKNTLLPQHMSGAKVVIDLGQGFDAKVGAEYRDTLYVLDLTLFYATFPQRMYRKHDPVTNRTVIWFERLQPGWVQPAVWAKYDQQMKHALATMNKRWLGSSVVQVEEVYGMFVVEPGTTRKTRVRFISKLAFGDDAGWVAKLGSQMPSVLKSGLRSGFGACVDIAAKQQAARAR